jgi:hypothetical protein
LTSNTAPSEKKLKKIIENKKKTSPSRLSKNVNIPATELETLI